MARSTVSIKFTGSTDLLPFALELLITYPRQRVIHTFTALNETLDVSDICSADELNRNEVYADLVDAGTFETVFAAGDSDIQSVAPSAVADAVGGLGIPVIQSFTLTAAVTGAADDVTLYDANAPFKMRILDAWVYLTASTGASTLQVRSEAAGAGTLMVPAISSGANGFARAAGTTPTATSTIEAGGDLFCRRSDRAAAGVLYILAVRES